MPREPKSCQVPRSDGRSVRSRICTEVQVTASSVFNICKSRPADDECLSLLTARTTFREFYASLDRHDGFMVKAGPRGVRESYTTKEHDSICTRALWAYTHVKWAFSEPASSGSTSTEHIFILPRGPGQAKSAWAQSKARGV